MAINWDGAAAGFHGYQDQARRSADDERRAKAAARADQEAAFAEEQRARQRYDWGEVDRIRAADKADLADVKKMFAGDDSEAGDGALELSVAQEQVDADATRAAIDGAMAAPPEYAPTSPVGVMAKDPTAPNWTSTSPVPATSPVKLAPAVAEKVRALRGQGGVPKAHDFNNTLEVQTELIRRKGARGDLTPEEYAQKMSFLARARNEGISDALALLSQGRYDEAMAHYNASGLMKGARLIKGQEGTTHINGEEVPTHFVTIANPDGSRTSMDVAKARYQMLDMDAQLRHVDRARQVQMQRDHHTDTVKLSREQLAQQAKDAAAGRALQGRHFGIVEAQFNAGTPLGQIQAKEKALGRTLTADERSTMLGVDALAPATRMQLNSLFKEQDQISAALNKAQAEGTWAPDSPGGRSMQIRAATISAQINDLVAGSAAGKAQGDLLGFDAASAATPATVENPVAPAAPPQAAALAPVAGVRAPTSSLDVRNDPALSALRKAIGGIDKTDPAQVPTLMNLGTAYNKRIEQLKKSNGTNIITE